MAGRVIEKGLVLTPTMLLALVLAIAGAMGTFYWRMSDRLDKQNDSYSQELRDQRDMLVEIRTELRLKKENDEKDRQRLEHQIGDLFAWQQVTNKDLARLIPSRQLK